MAVTSAAGHGPSPVLRRNAAVSVSVSFSPVHGRSGETRSRPHAGGQPPMNPGERPRTTPTTPPPQLESVLGATPHEFESRILRQCLTGHDVEGPHRKVGPFDVVLRPRCPGFCPVASAIAPAARRCPSSPCGSSPRPAAQGHADRTGTRPRSAANAFRDGHRPSPGARAICPLSVSGASWASCPNEGREGRVSMPIVSLPILSAPEAFPCIASSGGTAS